VNTYCLICRYSGTSTGSHYGGRRDNPVSQVPYSGQVATGVTTPTNYSPGRIVPPFAQEEWKRADPKRLPLGNNFGQSSRDGANSSGGVRRHEKY